MLYRARSATDKQDMRRLTLCLCGGAGREVRSESLAAQALVMWPLDDADEEGSRAASSNTCPRAALLFCMGLGRGWDVARGGSRSLFL